MITDETYSPEDAASAYTARYAVVLTAEAAVAALPLVVDGHTYRDFHCDLDKLTECVRRRVHEAISESCVTVTVTGTDDVDEMNDAAAEVVQQRIDEGLLGDNGLSDIVERAVLVSTAAQFVEWLVAGQHDAVDENGNRHQVFDVLQYRSFDDFDPDRLSQDERNANNMAGQVAMAAAMVSAAGTVPVDRIVMHALREVTP